jgi:predicted nucleotidyltransferase
MTSSSFGPTQIVLVDDVQLGQVLLHGVGCHEREPGIDAILRELVGERTQEETTKHASEAGTVGIPLSIVKAPSGHVVRRKVLGKEPVPTSEGDSITQNSTTDGVS